MAALRVLFLIHIKRSISVATMQECMCGNWGEGACEQVRYFLKTVAHRPMIVSSSLCPILLLLLKTTNNTLGISCREAPGVTR